MSLQRIQTNKEFSRDVVVGMITIVSLFGIMLFVAVQRFTGRSISPLAYLYSDSGEASKSAPVKIFATEEDRLAARAVMKEAPSIDEVAKKIKQISKSLRQNLNSNNTPIQLVSHHDNVSGKVTETENVFAPKPFSTAKTDHSFPSKHRPNNTGVLHPKTQSETPPKFQPDPTIPPTSAAVAKPQSFPKSLGVTRFQSPETDVDRDRPNGQPFSEPKQPGTPESNEPNYVPDSVPFTKPTTAFEESRHGTDSTSTIENSSLNPSDSRRSDKRIQPKKNDSFWTIANREYGDGRLFRQLAAYNRCLENSDIMPRTVLIPDLPKLQRVKVEIQSEQLLEDSTSKLPKPVDTSADESKLPRKYIVQKDETLFEISKQELGQAVRFVEIIQLNRSILPADVDGETRLQAGIELVVPK